MATARTIERLADVLVPEYAACAAVVLVDRDGAVEDSSARHDDASKDPLVRRFVDIAGAPGGLMHSAIMTGQSMILDDDDAYTGANAALSPLMHGIGAHSTLCVPFGDRAGAVAVLSDQPQAYGEAEVAMIEAVGRFAERLLVPGPAGERRRDQMLSEVHHDLGNPLLVLQISLDALFRASPEDNPGHRHLESARRALAQIRELANQLNDFVGTAEAITDRVAQSSAGPVVSEIVATLAPLAHEQDVKLAATLGDAGASVRMRRQDLIRVLSNVVGNAIRHTHGQGLVVVSTARSGDSVVFRVQDNGAGIDPADVARLYDAEWLKTSSIRKGRGLGLAIVKRLVERAGGKIGVHSRLGVGSSFWFKLPIA